MKSRVKDLILIACKGFGLFHLARLMTGAGLRILCYHGFALGDEACFRPRLFMTPSTFGKRLNALSKHGFPVLSLGEALERLGQGTLPRGATVITIDDGFYSVHRVAAGHLRARGFPATTYVSTYYLEKQVPIYRLAVQYLFWRTQRRQVEFPDKPWGEDQIVDLTNEEPRHRITWEIIGYGEKHCTEDERQAIVEELGAVLGVDYGPIKSSRSLSLLTRAEVAELAKQGMDIQLHTHRHRLPADREEDVQEEINENRKILEEIVGRRLCHLCYPSGLWTRTQWPWLERLDIESATTCMAGFNYAHTPPLGLRRFLDGEHISQIVFEAELFGFLELLRRMRSIVTRAARRSTH